MIEEIGHIARLTFEIVVFIGSSTDTFWSVCRGKNVNIDCSHELLKGRLDNQWTGKISMGKRVEAEVRESSRLEMGRTQRK